MNKNLLGLLAGVAILAGGVGYFAGKAPQTEDVAATPQTIAKAGDRLAIDPVRPKAESKADIAPKKTVIDDSASSENMREEAEANADAPSMAGKHYYRIAEDNPFYDVEKHADDQGKARLFAETSQVSNVGTLIKFEGQRFITFFVCQEHNCNASSNLIIINQENGDQYARNKTNGVMTVIRNVDDPVMRRFIDEKCFSNEC